MNRIAIRNGLFTLAVALGASVALADARPTPQNAYKVALVERTLAGVPAR